MAPDSPAESRSDRSPGLTPLMQLVLGLVLSAAVGFAGFTWTNANERFQRIEATGEARLARLEGEIDQRFERTGTRLTREAAVLEERLKEDRAFHAEQRLRIWDRLEALRGSEQDIARLLTRMDTIEKHLDRISGLLDRERGGAL